MPFGQPKFNRSDTTHICRVGYALEHDNQAKIPAWVAYRLDPQRLQRSCSARTNDWDSDPSLPPGKRSSARDYAKSGYDIGHMASNADMTWDIQVEVESNVTSNAAPQLPGLNRAGWLTLETRTRSWVLSENSPFLVYVGPIYPRQGASTIGKNAVTVPTAFYKVLVHLKKKEVVAFIYPQADTREPPEAFRTSLAEVQRQTGLVLPVPRDSRAPGTLWPMLASAVRSRGSVCTTQ